jgi:hypothetical protein
MRPGERRAAMQIGDVGTCAQQMRRHQCITKVAMGRRLAIRLYGMWRNTCGYSQSWESVRTWDTSVPDMA